MRIVGIALACLVGLVAMGPRAEAQGRYAEVTDADVLALRLNHYFTPDKKSHQPDFEWTFSKGGFVLKEGAGKIPGDLLKQLLPEGQSASEVRGTWKLADKGGKRLVLSPSQAAGAAKPKEASLTIYRSAPTVIRIGEVQYVFEVRR